MKFIKLFFPRLWFGLDDLDGAGGDPDMGNDTGADDGNDPSGADGTDANGDEIVIGENRVRLDDLRGNEQLKQYFDAYDNREQWQKANTEKAQEIAQIKRQADSYQRLMADPRFQQFMQGGQQQQSSNPKDQILQTFKQKWGNQVDPTFLGELIDAVGQVYAPMIDERINPIRQFIGSNWERDFLSSHPELKKGSDEYYQINDLINKGTDPELAYESVMGWANPNRRQGLLQKEIESAIKKRDEENRRKLKQNRTSGGAKGSKVSNNPDEIFEDAWAEFQDA